MGALPFVQLPPFRAVCFGHEPRRLVAVLRRYVVGDGFGRDGSGEGDASGGPDGPLPAGGRDGAGFVGREPGRRDGRPFDCEEGLSYGWDDVLSGAAAVLGTMRPEYTRIQLSTKRR